MHEILILYILLNGQNTLYGVAKSITKGFAHITNPSFGTIQPALKRLEKKGFVSSDGFFTDGGKPYVYYNITSKGKEFLTSKIKSKLPKNPIQLVPELKIKLMCSNLLEQDERVELLKYFKTELLKLKNSAENILNSDIYTNNTEARLVLDNSLCEYQNLLSLTEGLLKCRQ